MDKPILKKTIKQHQFEFEFELKPDRYMVKWVTIEADTDGTPRYAVTVHHWEQIGDELGRWFQISDTPVIIRKWLPTEKRSRKILPYYL